MFQPKDCRMRAAARWYTKLEIKSKLKYVVSVLNTNETY